MKFFLYKIIQKIYILFINRNIKISFSSCVNPLFLLKLNKKKDIIIDKSILDKNVNISEGTKIFEGCICSGNVNIGRYTSISGPNTRILSKKNSIKIGNFCSIAQNVNIFDSLHNYKRATSYYIERHILNDNLENDDISKGDILIEDDVWIGTNVVILSGIKIGRGAIIGAGSIVTKNIEAYSIVGGNPAKFIRKRFSNEVIRDLEESKWWEWDKEKIKRNKDFFKKNLYSNLKD